MSVVEESALRFGRAFSEEIQAALRNLDYVRIARVAALLYSAKEQGRQLFFFGNGGSHAIASHLACDFGKGTKLAGRREQRFYKAFALDNAAWLTAQANDGAEPFIKGGHSGSYTHGYDGVFVGQMENFIAEGDVAFGISSSGSSPNVVNALLYARDKGATTVALVGFDGGKAAQIAEHVILVATQRGMYGVVESVHAVVHHMLYEFAMKLERENIETA